MLVFLHHGLGSVAQWRDFPRRLSEASGIPAFAYDRAGHGQSHLPVRPRTSRYLHQEAAALAEVLDAQGIAEPILIGHSDGGSIALLYPAVTGRQPRAIVTIAAHVFVELETLAGIRAVQSSDVRSRLARYHGDKAGALFDAWAGIWLSDEFRSFNITAELAAIRCPVLAVQGAADEFGTPAQLEAIAAHVPQARTALIPGCGHDPHLEAPDALLAITTPAVVQRPVPPSAPARSESTPA